jgi:hypothetical protein
MEMERMVDKLDFIYPPTDLDLNLELELELEGLEV